MAEAYGKLTGRPGRVRRHARPGRDARERRRPHRGPGLDAARSCSSARFRAELLGREAFQEIDYEACSAPWPSGSARPTRPARIPELVARAFASRLSGRPGPVGARAAGGRPRRGGRVPDAAPVSRPRGPSRRTATSRRSGSSSRGASGRSSSSGEGGWSAQAGADVLGVLRGERRARRPPPSAARTTSTTRSPSYAGHLAIGLDPAPGRGACRRPTSCSPSAARLGDIATRGYTLLDVPRPRQTLVHAHPDPDELGSRLRARRSRSSRASRSSRSALRALEPVEPALAGVDRARRGPTTSRTSSTTPMPGELDLGEVDGRPARAPARWTRSSPRAPATSRSGRTASTSSAVYPSQLAPPSGAMGYGLPAALAAKVLQPERTVVCIAGDGDFLMSGQELGDGRAVRASDRRSRRQQRMYGTIRMHQERHVPRAGRRDRHREPRLRGSRGVVRRARRGGRADRGLRARARAGARGRQAGGAGAAWSTRRGSRPRATIGQLRGGAR